METQGNKTIKEMPNFLPIYIGFPFGKIIMVANYNMFPNNKLNVEIVTTGDDPNKHSIVQLTMWPVTPTPFGNQAFTITIQPYKEISKDFIDTEFLWVLSTNDPIYREADTLYGAWLGCKQYLKKSYCCAFNIKVVNRSIHGDKIFFNFLYSMCNDFYKDLGKEMLGCDWPFSYDISNFVCTKTQNNKCACGVPEKPFLHKKNASW